MSDTKAGETADGAPRKSKLAPLTEWRLPAAAPRPSDASLHGEAVYMPDDAPSLGRLPPWAWAAIGAGGMAFVLLIAVGAYWLGRQGATQGRADASIAQRAETASLHRRNERYPPVLLPGGLTIDRTSPMNYDLAVWLATAPGEAREFRFDRAMFEPGAAELVADHRAVLQGFAVVMASYPHAHATVAVPGPPALIEARIKALRESLLWLGMDAKQLEMQRGGTDGAPLTATVRLTKTVDHGLDS